MRRVVLENSAEGLSTISDDSAPHGIYLVSAGESGSVSGTTRRVDQNAALLGTGELELSELFGSTNCVPKLSEDNSGDVADWHAGVRPGEFKVRIATFGPYFEAEMHASDTFDIDIVISGEIRVTTEAGKQALLRSGDSVLIGGVRHGWQVGAGGCTVAIIMFGAAR